MPQRYPLSAARTWIACIVAVACLLPACQASGREQATTEPRAGADPKLNQQFVAADLDVEAWIGRFEIESREVYAARAEVVAAIGIAPGDRIADVGAGTGFYTRLFSGAVGDRGWVYAVEISPRFVEHINSTALADGLTNVTSVLSRVDSVMLPPGSVDKAFVCDTYHHFETPDATLASIHRALKPGGELVVIDFLRVEGVTREFLMNHVRAGKDVFRREIEAAGFELVADVPIEGFAENYFLKFKKR